MKFRIGTKISLLTCTMVLVASWSLSQRVMRYCENHLVDHEIGDLVDETNLSAQKVLRGADGMRQDITYLAAQIADDDRGILRDVLLTGFDPDEPSPKLRDPLNELLRKHPDFLQVEILAYQAGQNVKESTVVARYRRRTVKSLDLPAYRFEFLADVVASKPRFGQLSKFGQANVVYRNPQELAQLDPDPQYGPEDVPQNGRKLVLQGAAVILPAADRQHNDQPETGFVLLVTSHFRLLDSDMSNDDQLAVSPRHFLYLVDQDRRFLQHPDPTFVADLTSSHAAEPGKMLSDADPAVQERFQELHELMALRDGSDEVRLGKELGRTVRNKKIPSLKSWFGFTRGLQPGGQIVSFLDPEPEINDPEVPNDRILASRLKDALDDFLLKHPEYRASLPDHDTRRFKIRCQSNNQADLVWAEREIDMQLKQAGMTETVVWESPILLEDFALHLLRLAYEPNHTDRYLDLVVAVSYQEIAADVDAEMSRIKLGAVACSLGAGGLAVLFSLIITRPLKKIIISTRRLADGLDEELVDGKFDLVLPVHDRGEVGVLARSFQVMAEQIFERRQAVEIEQAKTRQLNEDLKRERDSLDVRVRERTAELQQTNRDLESARDAALEAHQAKSALLDQIESERRRADELLHVILPREIVAELKSTNAVVSRRYDDVAVLFADIVDFTSYCDRHPPEDVVQHLQRLVESWEETCLAYEVQKIKTIGDAFMAACGLLTRVENPVLNCIRLGLDMIAATQALSTGWNLRVGIHFGQVVGGVLGHRQYLFDLFGDTVNTAARMESHGVTGGIVLSSGAWGQVEPLCLGTQLDPTPVKGKGIVVRYRFDAFRP